MLKDKGLEADIFRGKVSNTSCYGWGFNGLGIVGLGVRMFKVYGLTN